MQNALLNTPVHDFDEMVVEQRGAPVGSGGGNQRDEGYYSRQNENYDDGNYNSGDNYDSQNYEPHNDTSGRQSEPRLDYPDDTGYNPGYRDTPRDEPVVYEPPSEPIYEPPSDPIIYEPAPSAADVPSPTDSDDKGRN